MKLIYKILSIFCILLSITIVIFDFYVYICIAKLDKTLLSKGNLLNNFNEKLVFYDINNDLVAKAFSNGQEAVSLKDMPEYVKYAFISIEDKTFYSHSGLNVKRILKSILDNITSGYAKSGASTISQQLIKNLHLSGEKTLKRKIQEAYLTTKLEKNFSKDEILETYLNVIYFGHNTFGIENAANKYFDCHAKDLKIFEAATLAAIIKSPSLYSPINNPQNCLTRRNLVLKEMLNDGYINEEQYEQESLKELNLKLQPNILDSNAYFKSSIQEAEQILGLDEKDIAEAHYKIYTFLDKKTQNNAINGIKEMNLGLNAAQSFCSIVVDNKTLGVKAYVTNTEQIIKRQPGSLIKPILCYAPAFEEGVLSPLTPIDDSPLNFPNWSPQNANGVFDGFISTRAALCNSKNIPAIKALSYVGIDGAKNYAQNTGIVFNEKDNHLALALGSLNAGLTPQTLLANYVTFANMGVFEPLHFISKIEDYAGRVIYSCPHTKTQAYSQETTYLINDVLKDCTQKGTAKILNELNINLAAKTGTVGNDNGNSDAWCIGYNKSLSILCWAGNLTGKPENNLNNSQNGGTITAKMCKTLWNQNKKYNEWFAVPEGIVKLSIDAIDYNEKHILNLASPNTPQEYVICDIFNKKFAPTSVSTNFLEIESPSLIVTKNNETLQFFFNEQTNLSYSLYCNFRLIKKNIHSNHSIKVPNQSCFFYIIAENKYSNQRKRSNIQVLLK